MDLSVFLKFSMMNVPCFCNWKKMNIILMEFSWGNHHISIQTYARIFAAALFVMLKNRKLLSVGQFNKL